MRGRESRGWGRGGRSTVDPRDAEVLRHFHRPVQHPVLPWESVRAHTFAMQTRCFRAIRFIFCRFGFGRIYFGIIILHSRTRESKLRTPFVRLSGPLFPATHPFAANLIMRVLQSIPVSNPSTAAIPPLLRSSNKFGHLRPGNKL